MKDEPIEYVEYLGRQVPKLGFRVYVYAQDEKLKLCNSYEEYQQAIESGMWFPSNTFKHKEFKNPKEKSQK